MQNKTLVSLFIVAFTTVGIFFYISHEETIEYSDSLSEAKVGSLFSQMMKIPPEKDEAAATLISALEIEDTPAFLDQVFYKMLGQLRVRLWLDLMKSFLKVEAEIPTKFKTRLTIKSCIAEQMTSGGVFCESLRRSLKGNDKLLALLKTYVFETRSNQAKMIFASHFMDKKNGCFKEEYGISEQLTAVMTYQINLDFKMAQKCLNIFRGKERVPWRENIVAMERFRMALISKKLQLEKEQLPSLTDIKIKDFYENLTMFQSILNLQLLAANFQNSEVIQKSKVIEQELGKLGLDNIKQSLFYLKSNLATPHDQLPQAPNYYSWISREVLRNRKKN